MTRAEIEAAIAKNSAQRIKLQARLEAMYDDWSKLKAELHRATVRELVGQAVRLRYPADAETRAWRATLIEVRRTRGTAVDANGKRWNVTLDQIIGADEEPGMSIRIGGAA